MRELLTIWIALFALVFTGCSSDSNTEPIPTPTPIEKPILTVGTCEQIAPEGGAYSVAFSIQNPIEGALCEAEYEVDWVHNFQFKEQELSFVVDPYEAEAGSEARAATITITYPEAESVSFQISQQAEELLSNIFTLTITRLLPDEVNYTLAVSDPTLTYLIGKTTRKSLDEAGSDRAFAVQVVQGYTWSESGLESQLKQGDITDGYFMFYNDDLQEENYLYLFGVTSEGKITSEVILQALELPARPTVTLSTLALQSPAEGGTLKVTYTIQNPIEGEVLSATPRQEDNWIEEVTVESGEVTVRCAANPNNVERTGEVRISYRSTPMQTLVIQQAANEQKEALTFSLEVVETHWNRVVVNCTPSDPEAYYLIGSISKRNFEGSGWGCCEGRDSEIPDTDLFNPYILQVVQGTQLNYVINDAVYSAQHGWEFYVYAYGVDKASAPTAATSEVHKLLVTLTDDRPEIHFDNLEEHYPAAGANLEIGYSILNPLEGGYIKVTNQSPTILSNLDDKTEGKVRFTLGPNSATTERTATLLFEYYLPDNEYVPVASAELLIHQQATM